jgi:hypothetical protein
VGNYGLKRILPFPVVTNATRGGVSGYEGGHLCVYVCVGMYVLLRLVFVQVCRSCYA